MGRLAPSVDAPAPHSTEKTTNFSMSLGSMADSSSGTSYAPSMGMNCVQNWWSMLSVLLARLLSTVTRYSLVCLRVNSMQPGSSCSSSLSTFSLCGSISL